MQLAHLGLPVWKEFKNEAENAMQITTNVLMKIIDKNKDTEYGKKYGFKDIHSIEDYCAKVPVTVYDDYAPYIERMVAGEQNILVSSPVGHFNLTSGTVGNAKRIPLTQEQIEVFMKYNRRHNDGLMADKLGFEWTKGRALCTSEGSAEELPNGITLGDASSVMAKAIKGGLIAMDTMMRTMFTSPVEAMFPGTENDTKYLHSLFALMDKNITGIVTGFYSSVVIILRYIEENWEMLVNDIENGTINEDVKISDNYRITLKEKITPMPERAKELRAIFSEGFDKPFIPRVWPNMCYIQGVGGDGFQVFDRIIRDRYAGESLHYCYYGITSSEGLWTVPFDLERTDSAVAPGSAFIEFLPVEAGNDFTKCVTLDHVEVGHIYELVITNFCGLYRYRMSDAVKVTGFYGTTPTVEFMYRVNKTVNLVAEKTTELALTQAVMNTTKKLGITLVDYTLLPYAEGVKPQYVFFFETINLPKRSEIKMIRDTLEEELCKANSEYRDYLRGGRLLPLELNILQSQTYLLYRDIMTMKGKSASQLKPVHVVGNPFQEKFFRTFVERELLE